MPTMISRSDLNQVGSEYLSRSNFKLMKTYEELERENRKLQSENDLLKVKLAVAKGNQCGIKPSDGEFHHRAFEKLCPMPDMSEITIFK